MRKSRCSSLKHLPWCAIACRRYFLGYNFSRLGFLCCLQDFQILFDWSNREQTKGHSLTELRSRMQEQQKNNTKAPTANTPNTKRDCGLERAPPPSLLCERFPSGCRLVRSANGAIFNEVCPRLGEMIAMGSITVGAPQLESRQVFTLHARRDLH